MSVLLGTRKSLPIARDPNRTLRKARSTLYQYSACTEVQQRSRELYHPGGARHLHEHHDARRDASSAIENRCQAYGALASGVRNQYGLLQRYGASSKSSGRYDIKSSRPRYSIIIDGNRRQHLQQRHHHRTVQFSSLARTLSPKASQSSSLDQNDNVDTPSSNKEGKVNNNQNHSIAKTDSQDRKKRRLVASAFRINLKRLLEYDDAVKEGKSQSDQRDTCMAFAENAIEMAEMLSTTALQGLELELIMTTAWIPTTLSGHTLEFQEIMNWHKRQRLVADYPNLRSTPKMQAIKGLADLSIKFNPDDTTTASSLRHSVGAMGHWIRAIEFDCGRFRVFPEIAFARTWATLALTTHQFLFDHDTFELESWVKGEKKKCTSPGFNKILSDTYTLTKRTSDLIRDYKHLINEGDTSLCPHPYKDYHQWHCQNFGALQRNRFDYIELTNQVRNTISELHSNGHNGGTKITKGRYALLKELSHSLNHEGEWRRIYRTSLERLSASASVDYFMYGKPPVTKHTGWFLPASSSQSDQESISEASKPQKINFVHDLYPHSSSIPIHYVASSQKLFSMLPALHDDQVLGYEVFRGEQLDSTALCVEYIVFASARGVIILDWQAIEPKFWIDTFKALQSIFQSSQILKVGFQCHEDSMFLWGWDAFNMKHYHNLPNASLPDADRDTTLQTLDAKTLDSKRTNEPMKFFRYLASRAYSALHEFHASNSNDVVITQPEGLPMDVSAARNEYKTRRQHRDQNNQLSFGPVTIDRFGKFAFNKKGHPRRIEVCKSRNSNLASMCLTEARNLEEAHLANPSNTSVDADSSNSSTNTSKDTSTTEGTKAIAAYYMGAIFDENLHSITRALGIVPKKKSERIESSDVAQCAARILWAVNKYQLTLGEGDRALLTRYADGVEFENLSGNEGTDSDHLEENRNTQEDNKSRSQSNAKSRTRQRQMRKQKQTQKQTRKQNQRQNQRQRQ